MRFCTETLMEDDDGPVKIVRWNVAFVGFLTDWSEEERPRAQQDSHTQRWSPLQCP